MKISKNLSPYLSSIAPNYTITNKGKFSSSETYKQEKIFQNSIYENLKDDNRIVDFEIENLKYGKINNNLMSIEPTDTHFSSITEDVYVLNFVADAYNEFITKLEILKQEKKIPKDSQVYKFEAQKIPFGTVDDEYYKYMNNLYASFYDFLEYFKYDNKIKNFDSFIKAYIDFIELRTPQFVFNKSSFIQSKYCPRYSSGMFINLLKFDINDDAKKIDLFFNPLFNCVLQDTFNSVFLNLIEECGFVINKDIPWQIVANLDSPKIKFHFYKRLTEIIPQNQMPLQLSSLKYEENIESLEKFDLRSFLFSENNIDIFKVVDYEDINNLKILMSRMYNQYCSSVEKVVEKNVVKNNNTFEIKEKATELSFISEEILLNEKIDYMWIRFYTFLKGRENSVSWNQSKFEDINTKFASILKGLDIRAAMKYLQSEISLDRKNLKQRNFFF